MRFLVTTRLEVVPTDKQVVMLDGTVPGWKKKEGDLHFDHHRPGGPKVQIGEINSQWFEDIKDDAIICTTQVDADACVAAAWILWGKFNPGYGETVDALMIEDGFEKLYAIAYDCDHLAVPDEYAKYADFAAQAVAAMKSNSDSLIMELDLPLNRKEWSIEQKELFASKAFEKGTMDLIAACKGERPFPGELGEAKEYWKKVETYTQLLKNENRVKEYQGCLIIDYKGLGGQYIDPRAACRAVINLPKLPITLAQREVYANSEFKGYSYTLGVLPLHPDVDNVDYTNGVFEALSNAEKVINPNADGWGGRKTVGGSGWNTPSNLQPQEVIDIVLKVINF